MPRITNFDTLPIFAATGVQGPAVTATFPFARPSLSQHAAVHVINQLIARWRAARIARRNVHALAALSDSALCDIGLNRANIVSAATEAGLPALRADVNE